MAKGGNRQAVFFDLHGILVHPWTDREDYVRPRFFEGALDALSRLDHNKMMLFIATNQHGVAEGVLRERDFKRFQEAVLEKFDEARVPITKVYACLYHPKGKGRWRKESVFRKPNVGMFKMAEQEFDLNLTRSWLLCDSTADVLAGSRAGVGTILLETGLAGRDKEFIVEPHFRAPTMRSAVSDINSYELSLTR